jgi:hypothetical protein
MPKSSQCVYIGVEYDNKKFHDWNINTTFQERNWGRLGGWEQKRAMRHSLNFRVTFSPCKIGPSAQYCPPDRIIKFNICIVELSASYCTQSGGDAAWEFEMLRVLAMRHDWQRHLQYVRNLPSIHCPDHRSVMNVRLLNPPNPLS